MNKVTAGLIVMVYIGYSLPFGDDSIKPCAHVLHDVSITAVKKLKFYCNFHQYLMHKENVFWKYCLKIKRIKDDNQSMTIDVN